MLTIRIWFQELTLKLLHLFSRDRYLAQHSHELPEHVHKRRIYLIGEHGQPWLIAFECPCGCKSLIQLNTLKDATPCWSYEIQTFRRISLAPSIWRKVGCKSHFWVRNGKIKWT